MAAFVTDQFRILNATNFVESVSDTNNSYYIFLGLPNPTEAAPNGGNAFGRNADWNNSETVAGMPPDPYDNFEYLSFYKEVGMFGKRVTKDNVRRVIRKVEWKANTKYDMYRHDYSRDNTAPVSNASRLYNANYYVINKDFRVYICIDNGSSGSNPTVTSSKFEPTFTDSQPGPDAGDGYIWKYLFTVAPSDIIKFDSTEYIVVPNDWSTSTGEIERIRNAGDSNTNLNGQIKKVYIENGGTGYSNLTGRNIVGDGTGGTVDITTNSDGKITDVTIATGGYGYTFGFVDLPGTSGTKAKLIPIIPPSRGHGYDIYKELGADRVLMYARFDDSTRDFPSDTHFSQVGILKNPTQPSSDTLFAGQTYSSLYAIKFDPDNFSVTPTIGQKIRQQNSDGTITARGYVASYDSLTGVLKYVVDRSNYFGADQTDVDNSPNLIGFDSSNTTVYFGDDSVTNLTGTIDTVSVSKVGTIDLGITLSNGLASPEINKSTGEILYIDNRKVVVRNLRQKEDVKIILEF